jgi:hypothetical protein
MREKKIIAVVGATGGQGGGLARVILADESSGVRKPKISPFLAKGATFRSARLRSDQAASVSDIPE